MHESTEEVVSDIRNIITDFKTNIAGRLTRLEDDNKRLKQIGFRLGSSAGDQPAAGQLQLQTSPELQKFLSSPRGKKSAASFEIPFTLEQKAVTPILNAGGTTYYPGVQGPPQPALRLASLIPNISLPMGSAVEYSQETAFTPGATPVVEGALKPGTALTFQNKLCTIQTVASILKVSVQSLMDVPSLQLWLSSRLLYAVSLAVEDLLLNDATNGLLALAGSLAAGFTPGTGATALDAIAGAIAQLQSLGFTPDGIVLSAVDLNNARLLKSTQGEYIWADPDSAIGSSAMWGIPTIISPKLAPGQFLVGAFAESCILFVRQLLNIELSFENEDDFIHNLACMRAEQRCGLAVPVPAGLVKGAATVVAAANGHAAPTHTVRK
jgi:hypothetical protein